VQRPLPALRPRPRRRRLSLVNLPGAQRRKRLPLLPSEENRWRRRGFNATPAAPRYPSAADRRQAGGKLQATDKDGRYPRNREHATSAPRGLVFPQISPFPLGIPVGPIILDLVFFHFFFFGAMGLDHKFTTILAWIFFLKKNILPW